MHELFLERLPSTARMVLASSATTLLLTELAEMTDRIIEVVIHPPTVAPVTTPITTVDDICQLTDKLTRLFVTLELP